MDSKLSQGEVNTAESPLRLTVLQFPHASRNTDFEPLLRDPRVAVRFARLTHDWGRPDAILIPGGRRTADDMKLFHRLGATRRIQDYVAGGGVVLGICGGFQMLGQRFADPQGIDGRSKAVRGLGLLPVVTTFEPDHIACLTTMKCLLPELAGLEIKGRESRYGRSWVQPHNGDFLDLHTVLDRGERGVRPADGHLDGLVRADRQVWGTYLHRIFENEAWNERFFDFLRRRRAHRPTQR